MAKKPQIIMVWLLPLILIGGLFYPFLGYLVVVMMAVLLILSFFSPGKYKFFWKLLFYQILFSCQ